MKFSVSSAELSKVLSMASGAIGTGAVIYILEDFLFELEGNKLNISATNIEVSIKTTIEVQGEEDGKAAIPARILLDTLKAMPAQPISFDINEETNMVELESSFGKYKLAFDKVDDFPELSQPDKEDIMTIPSEILQHAISNTLFAISNDDMRLAMTGLYVQIDFDKVTFVATDAHKLVKYTYRAVESNFATHFIVPKKALSLLKSILPSNTNIEVSFDDKFVYFTWGNSWMSCRLIDAQFPDYNVVIPVESPYQMTVSKEALNSCLKRISIYANKTTNQVAFHIVDKSLTVKAQDLDFNNEAVEQLSCEFDGESMTIGFNAKFIIEMLNVLDTDEIVMKLIDPAHAGLIIPVDIDENEDLLMLIMPVMIPRMSPTES
jgi:DNA polymerase III subunit beta